MKGLGVASHLADYTYDVTIINCQPSLTLNICLDFVHHSRKIGQKCCLLALDIAGTFDKAWHPGILDSLWK
jgi:hypothetical protein